MQLSGLSRVSRIVFLTLALSVGGDNTSFAVENKPVDYVRPQIDTRKSRWFYFSSASRPFGMVSLSPDTQTRGSWNSGYLYDKLHIQCFSHIHCWQLAGVPVMPTTGPILGHLGFKACQSPFSHSNETVSPGYHKVVLDRYGITVELTSTSRVGMHRYTYPKGQDANVMFDVGAFLAHGKISKASFRQVSATELAGYSVLAPTSRRQKPLTVYYVAQFNQPIVTCGTWKPINGKKTLVDASAQEGKDIGGYVSFGDLKGTPLLMKVGISYVSEEQAKLNLVSELNHWNFDRVVQESRNDWNQELGKIKVEGGSTSERIKFYTDLWHSLLGRHTFSDVNGKYVDNTGSKPQIRQVPLKNGTPVRNTYNSDGFWGAEFNLNILWSLAYPKVLSDFVSTMVDYYRNGGLIARGPSGGNYTYVMVGDTTIPLIAAAYNKGIRDFDIQGAYDGSLKNSESGGIRDHAGYELNPNCYMEWYATHGYVPEGLPGKGGHREGCAMTLYFAYQDWCMAQFAQAIGQRETAEKYLKRSFNYRNVFDPSVGWMRPRNQDGSWLTPFAPTGKGFNMPGFVESNSAIFTYYVPHNVPDLITLLGGNRAFIDKLNEQFEKAAPKRFITPHGAHAGNWVDYENQPSLHMAHLFSHAGAPWLTQYWVRRIKQEVFGDITPYGGYNGDEDQGQMGAYGVLTAIGLFDIQGGAAVNPSYEITTPLFDKVVITLDNRYYPGQHFVIETLNNKPGNIYIQRAELNGKPWNSFRIPHSELIKGGKLILELGNQPNKSWGIQ